MPIPETLTAQILFLIAAAAVLLPAIVLVIRRRRMIAAATGPAAESVETVDPRETRIHQCAAVVRQVLLHVMDAIRRMEEAAGESCASLQDARRQIVELDPAESLQAVQARVLGEVDRLIAANLALRRELGESRTTLAEQQRQIDGLRTAVRTDDLTGLPNRTSFGEQFQAAFERYRRFREEFVLLMMDLDHFKAINDAHGHPAGDRVLKGVALRLRASLRAVDFLARLGGEEFVAILPRTRSTEACASGERIRRDVEAAKFVLDQETIRVTLSIGAAEVSAPDTAESLMRRADEALYRAKSEGRNCFRVEEAPPEGADG